VGGRRDRLVAEDHLDQSGGVAQVDEDHATVVASACDPPGDGDGLRRVGAAQRTCGMRAEH